MPGTLTEQGKEQVQRAAEQLSTEGVKYTRIVSSDLKRAMDSAQIIADKLNLPIIPMKILRERDWGKFTEMPIADAMDKYRVDGKWQFPEPTPNREQHVAMLTSLADLMATMPGIPDDHTILLQFLSA